MAETRLALEQVSDVFVAETGIATAKPATDSFEPSLYLATVRDRPLTVSLPGAGASPIGSLKTLLTADASHAPDCIGWIQAKGRTIERRKTAHVSKAPLQCDLAYRKQVLRSRQLIVDCLKSNLSQI